MSVRVPSGQQHQLCNALLINVVKKARSTRILVCVLLLALFFLLSLRGVLKLC